MTMTAGGPAAQPAPQASSVPVCVHCGTDQYLIVEEFTPQRLLPDGRNVAASASYSCSRCGYFGGHEVPASWTPVGWFWYA